MADLFAVIRACEREPSVSRVSGDSLICFAYVLYAQDAIDVLTAVDLCGMEYKVLQMGWGWASGG